MDQHNGELKRKLRDSYERSELEPVTTEGSYRLLSPKGIREMVGERSELESLIPLGVKRSNDEPDDELDDEELDDEEYDDDDEFEDEDFDEEDEDFDDEDDDFDEDA